MDKPKSDLDFIFMSFSYKLRDLFLPRENILKEARIERGFHILDYGCGPGGYIIPTSKLVGESGKIYALDIHPLAVQMVQKLASKKRLANVETILSDCETGLPDSSIDVILLYDTLHALSDSNRVLEELHRVLKPGGTLSLSDHHLEENEIMSRVTNAELFKLSEKGEKTYSFSKVER